MKATVNSVVRQFYPQYLKQYSPSPQQAKAAMSIMRCKTPEMGGNASTCTECGSVAIHYNSCRNRHCPLCQGVTREIWVDQRLKEVVEAPYFHVVFTVPQQLQMLIYQNQKLLYSLMYQTVSRTLLELCQDDKYLGAQPGFMCVLHTWGQDLHYHPHIHALVMAGGLTRHNKWRKSYYGILASRNKPTKLELCRKITQSMLYKPRHEGLTKVEIVSLMFKRDVTVCSCCQKGKLIRLPLATPP